MADNRSSQKVLYSGSGSFMESATTSPRHPRYGRPAKSAFRVMASID